MRQEMRNRQEKWHLWGPGWDSNTPTARLNRAHPAPTFPVPASAESGYSQGIYLNCSVSAT